MDNIMDFLRQPWPWYVGGVLIGLMVPLLLIYGNKRFGLSSSFRHICAAVIPAKMEFFNYDWKAYRWNLLLVAGIAIGGFVGATFLNNPAPIAISERTKADLTALGITDFSGYVPREIINWDNLFTLPGFILIVIGGFLIGFGTRYADGCTSGHSITGLSMLSWPSLVATVCFMVGGILMTHFILPYILQ
ncbi:MAG: hypothetical protein KatS3mg031_0735 [Chitinophagales bacterium]|nr:MAG: hypothetical protein KatS3mg031_0735 [Chitinophagales bacterium]